jgi:hypothetical protein
MNLVGKCLSKFLQFYTNMWQWVHRRKHFLISVTLLFHTKHQIHDTHLHRIEVVVPILSCKLTIVPCAHFSRLFKVSNILHKNVTQVCVKGRHMGTKVYTISLVSGLNQPCVYFTFLSTLHEPISWNGKKNQLCATCHTLIRVHYII